MSILVLQSSRWDRESWLLCFVCLPSALDCCVALPHDADGVRLQFVIVVFHDHTHLLFLGPV